MRYKAPKAILNHPGVEECTSGEDGGSDYRHDIFLKEGWTFTQGRMAGCRGLLCNSVEQFRSACPVQSSARREETPRVEEEEVWL